VGSSSDPSPEINKTAATQKLREIIDAAASPLGSTGSGTAWALKALHPSDPLTTVEGIPDESTYCSTGLNYQQMYEVKPPNSTLASTWDCTVLFNTDPTVFATIMNIQAGGIPFLGNVVNSALGSTLPLAVAAMNADFSHWRLMYGGLSVHHSAPAVADQGTVVAAQYPIRPIERGSQSVWSPGELSRYPLIAFDQVDVIPVYDDLVRMPNAYVGLAKHGVYMPMKLESNHQQWHTKDDLRLDCSEYVVSPSSDKTLKAPYSQPGAAWPYVEAVGLYQDWFLVSSQAISTFCRATRWSEAFVLRASLLSPPCSLRSGWALRLVASRRVPSRLS